MRKRSVQWTVAVLLTLVSAVWQRWSGPTYPVKGAASIAGRRLPYRLLRTNSIAGRQPVEVLVADKRVEGVVEWRHYPTSESWRALPMTRRGDTLAAELPPAPEPLMPMAGKLQYRVRLNAPGAEAVFPDPPAVTRFKGDVPAWILLPHIAAMFFGMLFATRAALAAISGHPAQFAGFMATGLLLFGGFVLGPVVQKLAFGAYWTGIPWGYDLTDNKTLIAVVAWIPAAIQLVRKQDAKLMIVLAAVVTMTVFAIPHSVWGSEARW
jgi:hypothetical protein